MTRDEAMEYLRNLAASAEIPALQKALRQALEDMERAAAMERDVERG